MEKIEYYPYLDTLKGLAILLMVMGHVIPWTMDNPLFLQEPLHCLSGNQLASSIVYKLIYSFHMPLLFFVSGFLFYKPCELHNSNWLYRCCKKRTYRIFVPYLVSGSLLWVCRGQWGYWFLQCLFFLNVICALTFWISHKMKNNLLCEVLVYLFVYICLLFLSRHCVNLEDETNGIVVIGRLYKFYPPFLFGIVMRKYNRLGCILSNKYFVLFCLLLYCFIFINTQFTKYPFWGLLSTILLPLSMINFLYYLFKNNIKMGGAKIDYIGKNSMEIYILHVFFVMIFKEVGYYILSIDTIITNVVFQLVYSFIISVIAIVLSIITAEFLKGSELLKKYLFGL